MQNEDLASGGRRQRRNRGIDERRHESMRDRVIGDRREEAERQKQRRREERHGRTELGRDEDPEDRVLAQKRGVIDIVNRVRSILAAEGRIMGGDPIGEEETELYTDMLQEIENVDRDIFDLEESPGLPDGLSLSLERQRNLMQKAVRRVTQARYTEALEDNGRVIEREQRTIEDLGARLERAEAERRLFEAHARTVQDAADREVQMGVDKELRARGLEVQLEKAKKEAKIHELDARVTQSAVDKETQRGAEQTRKMVELGRRIAALQEELKASKEVLKEKEKEKRDLRAQLDALGKSNVANKRSINRTTIENLELGRVKKVRDAVDKPGTDRVKEWNKQIEELEKEMKEYEEIDKKYPNTGRDKEAAMYKDSLLPWARGQRDREAERGKQRKTRRGGILAGIVALVTGLLSTIIAYVVEMANALSGAQGEIEEKTKNIPAEVEKGIDGQVKDLPKKILTGTAIVGFVMLVIAFFLKMRFSIR